MWITCKRRTSKQGARNFTMKLQKKSLQSVHDSLIRIFGSHYRSQKKKKRNDTSCGVEYQRKTEIMAMATSIVSVNSWQHGWSHVESSVSLPFLLCCLLVFLNVQFECPGAHSVYRRVAICCRRGQCRAGLKNDQCMGALCSFGILDLLRCKTTNPCTLLCASKNS